jgi:hypothetical protein
MERRQIEYLCVRKKQQKHINVHIIRPFDCTLTSETGVREIRGFRRLSSRFVANNIIYEGPIIHFSNYIALLLPKIRRYTLRNVAVQQMLIVSDKFTKKFFIIAGNILKFTPWIPLIRSGISCFNTAEFTSSHLKIHKCHQSHLRDLRA